MRRNSPATELSDLPPGGTPPGETPADPPYLRPCRGLHSLPQSALHAAVCTPRRGLHSLPPETMRTAATKMPVFTNPIELVRDRQAPCPGLRTQEPGRTSAAPALCCLCPIFVSTSAPALCLCRRDLCRPNSRPGLPGDAPRRSDHLPRLRHNRAPDSARRNPCSAVSSAALADGPGLRSVSAPAAGAAPSVLCARHAFFRNAAAARDAPKTGKGMPLSGHPFLLFCISTATGCAALPARQTEPPLRNPWASTFTFPEGNAPARYRYQRLATLMRAMARARASSARCTSVSGLGSDRRCSARALACSARSTSMSAASSAASASTVILLSAT